MQEQSEAPDHSDEWLVEVIALPTHIGETEGRSRAVLLSNGKVPLLVIGVFGCCPTPEMLIPGSAAVAIGMALSRVRLGVRLLLTE